MKPAEQSAPQGADNNPTAVTAAVLVVFMLIVVNAWKVRRRRQQKDNEVVVTQDMPGLMDVSVSLTVTESKVSSSLL